MTRWFWTSYTFVWLFGIFLMLAALSDNKWWLMAASVSIVAFTTCMVVDLVRNRDVPSC